MPFEKWFNSNFDRRIEPYEQTQDEHGEHIDENRERITTLETQTPGVGPENTDPTRVIVGEDLAFNPDEDCVIETIWNDYIGRDPNDRCHEYVLPAGTYPVRRGVRNDEIDRHADSPQDTVGKFDAHTYFGLVGAPFADLNVVSPDVDMALFVGRRDSNWPHANRTELRNVRLDVRGEVDAGLAEWHSRRWGVIKNVEVIGQRNYQGPNGGSKHTLKVDAVHESASNEINVRLPSGDTLDPDADSIHDHAIACASERFHRGVNVWDRCYVSGWKNNAFYLTNGPGRNILKRSTVEENDGPNIRLGDNDRAEDCRIIKRNEPEIGWVGLWCAEGSPTVDGLKIDIACEKTNEVIRCNQGGRAVLRNVRLRDTGGNGRQIRVTGATTFEDCIIHARTTADSVDYMVYVRSPKCTFRDCEFVGASQTDSERRGIVAQRDIDDLSLRGCTVDADGQALRIDEDCHGMHVSGCRFEGSVDVSGTIYERTTPGALGGGGSGNW